MYLRTVSVILSVDECETAAQTERRIINALTHLSPGIDAGVSFSVEAESEKRYVDPKTLPTYTIVDDATGTSYLTTRGR